MTQLLDQESTALASCYSVESSTAKVQGFHYCTTPGTGIKSTILSPPLDIPAASAERNWPGITQPEHKGEATHTIPEECERLFCDRLSAIFLGERIGARQESLEWRWIEVWDYTGDAIYRGFVAELEGERTLFVFLEDEALSHGLKSGLIALFELAGIDAFNCSQIVACVRRSQQRSEVELVHNLGWCGFNLTTLEPWAMGTSSGPTLSTKWLFLVAEV
ncbi:hypothetical protein N7470_010442 [Penicillium chermesinum]|nr:hypothetical protein N7470_010442 [Penicillium chermesinum]